MIRVEISDWRDAPIDAHGERVFAVGDIHGCSVQLAAWLDACRSLRNGAARSERLVFLGDIVNRGPDSDGVIALWSKPEPIGGIARVHRLMGNHEQLEWLMRNERASHWEQLEVAVRIGNLVFVHAGVDPHVPLDEFLSIGKEVIADGGRHWAWIEKDFLTWTGGFGGRVIVHGHTPPAKHRAWTGWDDPHVLRDGKLCLDGGSAVTGIVAGAQLEDGRYRVIRAAVDSTAVIV